MWVYVVLVLLVAGLVFMLWRSRAERQRLERERAERRARTDELLARVLLGEKSNQGRAKAGARPSLAKPVQEPIDRMVKPAAGPGGGQRIDVDSLLSDEPTTIADRARRELAQPTNILGDGVTSPKAAKATAEPPATALPLREGQLDVPLDRLVVAWFAARGYVARLAPDAAQPITLLLNHPEEPERSYAFFYERGRLTTPRAVAAMNKARPLGMSKLLVAAEHGADPTIGSARMPDVHVMDWPAIDRAMRRIDARVAAKIVTIARAKRGLPAAD